MEVWYIFCLESLRSFLVILQSLIFFPVDRYLEVVGCVSASPWYSVGPSYFDSGHLFSPIFTVVQLIYNVVLILGVQKSNSVIHIHMFILLQILFSYRLLQCIEEGSLSYIAGSSWLSVYILYILYIVVCMLIPNS